MKALIIILIIIGIIIAVAAIYIYSGYYNVAATKPHSKLTLWLINEMRESSIEHYSKGIKSPPKISPDMIREGVEHFHEMCRLCHAAPGFAKEEFAEGLYPKPPDLASKDIQQADDAEIFWVIKNGIKLTGMPAFGPTHNDNEIWGMVRVVRRLPGLKPEQYKEMLESAGVEMGKEMHHHH